MFRALCAHHQGVKHVEAYNESRYKTRIFKLVNYQDYTEMHGQKNIKILSPSFER